MTFLSEVWLGTLATHHGHRYERRLFQLSVTCVKHHKSELNSDVWTSSIFWIHPSTVGLAPPARANRRFWWDQGEIHSLCFLPTVLQNLELHVRRVRRIRDDQLARATALPLTSLLGYIICTTQCKSSVFSSLNKDVHNQSSSLFPFTSL